MTGLRRIVQWCRLEGVLDGFERFARACMFPHYSGGILGSVEEEPHGDLLDTMFAYECRICNDLGSFCYEIFLLEVH